MFLHMRKKFFCKSALILPQLVILQQSVKSPQSSHSTTELVFAAGSDLPFIYFLIVKMIARD